MAKTGHDVPRCAYPGCENEPPPGEAGATAEPGYCGLPDPVTWEPHTALTAFRQRRVLAGQGGGTAGPMDPERPGLAFWRRRQRAEAEAGQARAAALEAEARLAEALAAKAAAEQQAAAEREAGQARAAQAERAAEQQVAGARQERDQARQERDEAVSAAESRAAEAESRAGTAGQDAGRAREAAQAARAEHGEAELQTTDADDDKAAGQATRRQPRRATRRQRSQGK